MRSSFIRRKFLKATTLATGTIIGGSLNYLNIAQ